MRHHVVGSRSLVDPAATHDVTHVANAIHDQVAFRYFSTAPDAARVVLQASVRSSNGEIDILDVGETAEVRDQAIDLTRRSGLAYPRRHSEHLQVHAVRREARLHPRAGRDIADVAR